MEFPLDPGTVMAIGYLIVFIVGVFIVSILAGATFDGVQKRAYNNRRKWDNEKSR